MGYKAESIPAQGTDFYDAFQTYIKGCVVCVLQKVKNVIYIYDEIYALEW
jgi:hypothetical protein